MAIKKSIFLIAFLITVILLGSVLLISSILNNERKEYLDDRMSIINEMSELQTYSLMSDVYGDKFACLAFKNKLAEWDKTIWDLGVKLEQYRVATEEFQKDPYYLDQKKKFNENELLYLLFLTKLNKECNFNQQIITSFYKNSEECIKCDDQSFVLTDIKNEKRDTISIFSFDMDLNITNLKLLKDYYEVTEYPCVIINEQKFCGIRSKEFILDKICVNNPDFCQEN